MRYAKVMLFAVSVGLPTAGCVKKSQFEAKVVELRGCQQQLQASQKALSDTQMVATSRGQRADSLDKTLKARTERANRDLGELQKQLDDATALNASLREALQKQGEDVDKLLREKGALASSLNKAKARLEELRRAQAAAQRHAETMRRLVERLRKVADAGNLSVVVRGGKMVLQLPNDVLFASGRAKLTSKGRETVKQVALALRAVKGRQFQVAGHTDDQPIHSRKFPSNWELSAARAIAVVKLMVASGMDPTRLAAVGYGPYSPVEPNDTKEHRASNRRIEIVVQPNLDEFIAVKGARW